MQQAASDSISKFLAISKIDFESFFEDYAAPICPGQENFLMTCEYYWQQVNIIIYIYYHLTHFHSKDFIMSNEYLFDILKFSGYELSLC